MTEVEKHRLMRMSLLSDDVLSDRTIAGRRHLVSRLRRLCQAERERGLANAWTYDQARHKGLVNALERERTELAAMIAATQRTRELEPA